MRTFKKKKRSANASTARSSETNFVQSQEDKHNFSSSSTFELQSKPKKNRSLQDVETQLQRARESNFNFAKMSLFPPIQRKTTMGEVGDEYEQSADNAGSEFSQSLQQSNSSQDKQKNTTQSLQNSSSPTTFQPKYQVSELPQRKVSLANNFSTDNSLQMARGKFGSFMSTMGFGLGGLIASPLGAIGGLFGGAYMGAKKGSKLGGNKGIKGGLGSFFGGLGGLLGGGIGGAVAGGLGTAVGGFAGAGFAGSSVFGSKSDRTRTEDLDGRGKNYQPQSITISGSGYSLKGYKYTPKERFKQKQTKNKAVILFSGSGGSNERMTEPVANMYAQQGITSFGVNYRGFGESRDQNIFGGKSNPIIMSEAGLYKDARRTYDYVNTKEGYNPKNITLHGFSLGGAVASHLAKKLAKNNIKLGGLVLHSSIATAYKAGKEASEEMGLPSPLAQLGGAGAKGSAGNFDTIKHLEQLAKRDPDLPIHFMSGSKKDGDQLGLDQTNLDQVGLGTFTNVTSNRVRGGHLNGSSTPRSHFGSMNHGGRRNDDMLGRLVSQGRDRQVQTKLDNTSNSLQRKQGDYNRSIQTKPVANSSSQPQPKLQLKQDNSKSPSNVSSQFWQNNLLTQPSLQKKSLPQTKTDSLQKKVDWGKWKRRIGIGVGGGTVAGGLGYGAGAGISALAGSGAVKTGLLAAGGVLAGMGPIGWGILAGAGGLAALGGLGYLGYKGWKRYKQGKERKQNALKAVTQKDLKEGDILLYGGSAGVNAGQAAASALRGFIKLATFQWRGGIKDLTSRMVDTSVGHAGIYVGKGSVAHATNDGFNLGNLPQDDTLWVYRSSDQSLTKEVSQMARSWSFKDIKYGTSTATKSAFGQSKFKSKGHLRAVKLSLYNCFHDEKNRQGAMKFERSWGSTVVADNYVPDTLICSEAAISIYQAAAYRKAVKDIFEEQKFQIFEDLRGDNPKKTFKQVVKDIAKQIPPESINKYSTLNLDAGNATPQRLSAKLSKWSLDPKNTGWTYVGLFDPLENERVKKEDRQRQMEEHRRKVEKLRKQLAEQKMDISDKLKGMM